MSVLSPARHPGRISYHVEIKRYFPRTPTLKRALFLLAMAGVNLLSRPTWAQPSEAIVLQIGELPERVYSTLSIDRSRVIDVGALQIRRHRQRALSRLERVRDVDHAIALARQATFALEEDRALRALSGAEHTLQETLALPGAALFYAELQLQLGVSAAHSGLLALADAAFARAASIDPTRALLAGEAAPEVVLLARRAFERVANAKEGTLHIAASSPAARVFIDDRALGEAPLTARVRGGLHVLRVEADGHAPYARLIDVLEGERPIWHIALSPDPYVLALRELEAAVSSRAGAREIEHASAHVFALEPALQRLVFGQRVLERGWFADCEPGERGERAVCTLGTYASLGGESLHVQRVATLTGSTLTDARAWLTPERSVVAATQAAAPSLWQRWYVWALAGAIVVGAGVGVAAASEPDPQRSLRVSVDPSALR
jgi:hypothetical protein